MTPHLLPEAANGAPTRASRARQAGRRPVPVFRVAAIPGATTDVDEVILSDRRGQTYLLSDSAPEPTPLEPRDADSLGMFFEPSQDSSWHTLPELRRIIFGGNETSAVY